MGFNKSSQYGVIKVRLDVIIPLVITRRGEFYYIRYIFNTQPNNNVRAHGNYVDKRLYYCVRIIFAIMDSLFPLQMHTESSIELEYAARQNLVF